MSEGTQSRRQRNETVNIKSVIRCHHVAFVVCKCVPVWHSIMRGLAMSIEKFVPVSGTRDVKKIPCNELEREQWMLAQTIVGVITAISAARCPSSLEPTAASITPCYAKSVARHVARGCGYSYGAIEDVIDILELAADCDEPQGV